MNFWKRMSLAFVALIVTIGPLWLANRPVPQKEVTWEDVLTEARDGGYKLIPMEELWKHYQKDPENLLLVDTRQDWEYRTGHIKDALHFPTEPTRWARWSRQGAIEAFLGSDNNRFIIFY